jgi:hypothetical protein
MWEPRRLTTLRASTACYRDNFTFLKFVKNLTIRQDKTFPTNWHNPFLQLILLRLCNRDVSVGIATIQRIGQPGFDPRQRKEISLFSTGSRPAPGPNQSPMRWVPKVFHPGIKWPCCEADHSPPSCIEVNNGGAIPPLSHISLRRGA